jgi:hypothetical protein
MLLGLEPKSNDDRSALFAGNDAEAVVLDLMQPIAAGGQFVSFGREARRDEPSRQGTLQHVD